MAAKSSSTTSLFAAFPSKEVFVSEKFKMPAAHEGMPVLWWKYCDTNAKPYVGWITHVGVDVVQIATLPPNARSFFIAEGVRHRDDQLAYRDAVKDAGCWDFTHEYKERLALGRRLADLEAMVKGLVKK
jgi:hypothetical protein